MKCIHCKYEDKDEFVFCPECGKTQKTEKVEAELKIELNEEFKPKPELEPELEPESEPELEEKVMPIKQKIGRPLNVI